MESRSEQKSANTYSTSMDRWHAKPRWSDQKLLINDVKNSLTIELRGVEGSTIVSEESPVGASAANAVFQMSVWETQNVVRAPRGCTELRLTLVVQIGLGLWRSRDMWSADPGQVFQVTGQRGERRKRKTHRKA